MLQQPSEAIMYQKLPLDLNMHSAEASNLQSDFKDIGLQLQAQRAAATQAFFLDAYSVRTAVPLSAAAVPVGVGVQGVYEYPFKAVYDPVLPHVQQHLQHHHPLHHHHQQKPHHHFQIQQQPLLLLRQHQRQEQNHVPTVVDASSMELWQQQQRQQLEKRGCWFPNWQEVFHGFAAGKEGNQGAPSTFQQQPTKQVTVEMPSVAATVGCREAQELHVHPDGAQVLEARSLSSPLPSHSAALLPHPPPVSKQERNDILNGGPHVNVARLRDGHLDRAESSGMSELLPTSSHFSTAIVPCSTLPGEKRGASSLVPCPDLRDPYSAGTIACKYTTQSPAWLPQGWITEVQTRRSGSTAGTRDKYYKDLVSGRRFRSRNEVIHYLQTGKGRLRSRRRRRAIASSSIGGQVNFLTHQSQSLAPHETSPPCLFLTPQPIGFMLGPHANTQPAHSVPPMVAEDVEAPYQTRAANLNACSTPCQTPAANLSSSSTPVIMLGLKRPVDSKPQKLPVHKKAKILSPKKSEDKQASRLWQWLHKPGPKMEEHPQKHDTEKQVSMAGEKKAPDIENQRKVDLGRELQNMPGTTQIGRDIEAAQRTVSQLGKEMQAVIEKLTQKIHTAKRDLKLGADATHKTDYAMSNIMQATQRLNSAMGNLTEATQSLALAFDSATQAPNFDVGIVSPVAKQPQAAAAGVVQRALWPDVAMVQSASSSHAVQVAGRTDHLRGNVMQTHMFPNVFMTYATEPSQRPDNSRACITQATHFSDVCARHATQPPHGSHNPGAYITQAAQSSDVCAHYMTQRPDLAMCNPTKVSQSSIIVRSYVSTQAITSGIVDAIGTTNVEKLSEEEQAYQKALEVSKQLMEERSRHLHKFSALNPDLDLSSLSPCLSSRQRAKEVQKMKAKHTRGLLVILGRKLCYEAIRKSCEDGLKQG